MLYKRKLPLPSQSFFLFGPRGTGKTTWLKQVLKKAIWFDLLDNSLYLRLLRNPTTFYQEIEALPPNHWIVIDEIQKLPLLLNEIHRLIANHGHDYHFALSGSSARKLKRMDADLLAGRISNRLFFPLSSIETNFDTQVDDLLHFGCLPQVRQMPEHAIDFLEAYIANYLKEEIQQEAFVKDFGSFTRFLEVAALCNTQIVNTANIARDSGVARPTVQRYFDVLVTTLIGNWLPAWRSKIKIKQIVHPKFYFFDPGVVRAINDQIREPLEKAEKGPLFETLIYHELRCAQNVLQCGGKFYFWRTPSGSEIDFIWSRGRRAIGIEVKSSNQHHSSHSKILKSLISERHIQAGYVINLGKSSGKDGPVHILPHQVFIKKLFQGQILT